MSELNALLEILPPLLRDAIEDADEMTEFILDLGRPLEVRYAASFTEFAHIVVTEAHLSHVIQRLSYFGPDNRAGIDGTLHRISRIVTRAGETVGLTCRCGRSVPGAAHLVYKYLDEGKNVLLLGPPGVGKTTMLRDAANYLAEESNVVIVDTSNEIAGEGRTPHPGVGRARRLQVPPKCKQDEVMIEAVENHTPDVVVIDEISSIDEAEAARTIAERGVQLVATAHGRHLADFLDNPPLKELVGGVQVVTLSDMVAGERGTPKTIRERKAPSTFDVIIEIVARDEIHVHVDVAGAVDRTLDAQSRGRVEMIHPEKWRLLDGKPTLLNPHEILKIGSKQGDRQKAPAVPRGLHDRETKSRKASLVLRGRR